MSTAAEIPDELVLAALDRAQRHRGREDSHVLLATIKRHLGLVHNSWTTRSVRPKLDALQAAGLVEHYRRNGCVVWALTDAGRQSLLDSRHAGRDLLLPESPQHREWSVANGVAIEHIGAFREDLRATLNEAKATLNTTGRPRSDDMFRLAEQLSQECRALGSAIHCLYEWREPSDAHADIDERIEPGEMDHDSVSRVRLASKRAGRRNIHHWIEQPTEGR